MANSIKILLISGGQSSEHEVTLRSTGMIRDALQDTNEFEIHEVLISKDGKWLYKDIPCHIDHNQKLVWDGGDTFIDYCIPYIHGHTGETGHFAALMELNGIPFFGPGQEAALNTFNKITTKLWCDRLQIPNTPYFFLVNEDKASLEKAKIFLKENERVFIKASNQGSSVGCYEVKTESELSHAIKEAFTLSPYVLMEKAIDGRELEVSVFEFEGKIHVSLPGEIQAPGFYSYDEKYAETSKTKTVTVAGDLSENTLRKIKDFSLKAFESFKLKDLARIDFFLDQNEQVSLNEINTFPGLTPISMFPKMMEAYGVEFKAFIKDRVNSSVNK